MLSKFSKRLIIVSSMFSLAIMLGIAIGQTREKNDVLKGIDLFGETIFYVKNRYVEAVNDNKIFGGALQGLAENLDPESFFMEPEEYEAYKKSGNRFPKDNIGIGIIKLFRFLRVISVEPGSPAAKAGIEVGDYIAHVEGRSGFDISIYQAYTLLAGKTGTKVSIDITKATSGKEEKMTITRNDFSVAAPIYDTFAGSCHYISLRHFYKEDIDYLLSVLNKPDRQPIIIDLRGNYYGSDEGLINALDAFIGEGNLYKIGNPKKGFKEYNSKPDKVQLSSPILIMVDESTCHYAETFAAVLSEKKLIKLYGRQTKGMIGIQTAYPIQNRGALYITTEIFQTPDGTNIYLKGIKPDVEITTELEAFDKAKLLKSDKGLIEKKDPLLEKTLELAGQKSK
jgi:carboxyl-terminal processing protease